MFGFQGWVTVPLAVRAIRSLGIPYGFWYSQSTGTVNGTVILDFVRGYGTVSIDFAF